MRTSESIVEISTAFLEAQRKMTSPKMDSTNPFFNSKYAGLPSVIHAVLPVLHEAGIAVIQGAFSTDGKGYATCRFIHTSGEWFESCIELAPGKQNDPQALGSCITYARRYLLCAMACVCPEEDDDGNAATTQAKPAKKKPARVDDKPAKKKPHEIPFAERMANAREALGDKKFFEILGARGYEKSEQVTNEAERELVLVDLRNAAKKGKS